jgi:PST family polysaccharide transporter
MALRVVTWPMGYIIVAQNRQVLFLAVELAWAMVVLALTWPAVARFGAPGAGLAFFASYVFQLGLIWPLVWRTSGLRWSRANLGAAAVYLAAIGCVFTGQRWLDAAPAMWLGTACLLLTTLHGARGLARLVDGPTLPAPLRRWTTGRPA